MVDVDLQKAFDSVSHQKLISKLEGYGICGNLLVWLKAFLSNRTQVVSISGCMSETVHITSGVPQGSVLGPTLFLLFITVCTVVQNCCNGRSKKYRKWHFWGCSLSETLQRIDIKFGRDNYVGDGSQYVKWHINRFRGVISAKG